MHFGHSHLLHFSQRKSYGIGNPVLANQSTSFAFEAVVHVVIIIDFHAMFVVPTSVLTHVLRVRLSVMMCSKCGWHMLVLFSVIIITYY